MSLFSNAYFLAFFVFFVFSVVQSLLLTCCPACKSKTAGRRFIEIRIADQARKIKRLNHEEHEEHEGEPKG